MTGEYPRDSSHSLGLYDLLELLGTNATVNDLDDHTRVKAGAILLGINLARHQSARGLNLNLSFRERDL